MSYISKIYINISHLIKNYNPFWLLLNKFFVFYPASIKGQYNFSRNDYFYCIVLGEKRFFLEEINNIQQIKKIFPAIAEHIPNYEYSSYFNGKILRRKSSFLNQIINKNELYSSAAGLFKVFNGNSECTNFDLDNLPFIKKGIEIILTISPANCFTSLEEIVKNILLENKFHNGFCHGDFHAKNIMQHNDYSYIIDHDCTRLNSIQEFDVIYFVVQEFVENLGGVSWFYALAGFKSQVKQNDALSKLLYSCIGQNKLNSLLLLFFLDRFGQDAKYFKTYNWFSKEVVLLTLNILLDNFNNKN